MIVSILLLLVLYHLFSRYLNLSHAKADINLCLQSLLIGEMDIIVSEICVWEREMPILRVCGVLSLQMKSGG